MSETLGPWLIARECVLTLLSHSDTPFFSIQLHSSPFGRGAWSHPVEEGLAAPLVVRYRVLRLFRHALRELRVEAVRALLSLQDKADDETGCNLPERRERFKRDKQWETTATKKQPTIFQEHLGNNGNTNQPTIPKGTNCRKTQHTIPPESVPPREP